MMNLKGVAPLHLANDESQFIWWCLLGCAHKLGKTGQNQVLYLHSSGPTVWSGGGRRCKGRLMTSLILISFSAALRCK